MNRLPRYLRGTRCGVCGRMLMRFGRMRGMAFLVPWHRSEPLRCQTCAIAAGLWDDENEVTT